MRNPKSMVIILAIVTAGTALVTSAVGQEGTKAKLERAKQELDKLTKELELKPGAELVALKSAQLRAGKQVVGTVRKGQKLSVAQVQDNWLWVRSGETRGWIDRRGVLSASLMEWYQRLPDNNWVEAAGRTRAKFEGVMFDIQNAGPWEAAVGTSLFSPAGPCAIIIYSRVALYLETCDEHGSKNRFGKHRTLHLAFDPADKRLKSPPPPGTEDSLSLVGPGSAISAKSLERHLYGFNVPIPAPAGAKGQSYGTVASADFVLVHTNARQVFVNGEVRRPQ